MAKSGPKSDSRKRGIGAGGVRPDRSTKKDIIPPSAQGLSAIADPKLRKEVQAAISRFSTVFGGVPERVVKVVDFAADFGPRFANSFAVQAVGGVAVSFYRGVFLNKKWVDDPKAFRANVRHQFDAGWFSRTSQPIRHIVIHELAHAKWSSQKNSRNARKAAPEISKLYRQWRREKRPGWGNYARVNRDEFVAEALTKHAMGSRDRYTRKLMKILEANNL